MSDARNKWTCAEATTLALDCSVDGVGASHSMVDRIAALKHGKVE